MKEGGVIQYLEEVSLLRTKLVARHHAGEYVKCVYIGEKLIQLHRKNKNTRSVNYADDLFNLALAYDDIGKFNRAADLYSDSLRIIETVLGTGLEYAVRLTNLAVAHSKLGNHDTALGMHMQSESIKKKLLGREHPDTVESSYNMANALYDSGMYKRALRAHERVLNIRKKNTNCLAYADSLNSCGYCHEVLGDANEADEYYNLAMDITREISGELTDEYIADMLYYASFLSKDERNDEAARVYNKAALLIKRLYTENHMHYAGVLNCAADVYEKLGNEKKSLALKVRAMKIIKKALGGNHLYLANYLKTVALGYHCIGDDINAIKLLKQTLKIKESLIGCVNESYVRDMLLLVLFYLERYEYKKITGALKNALKNVDLSDPEVPPYFAGIRELCLLTNEMAKIKSDVDGSSGFTDRPLSADLRKAEALTELFKRISENLDIRQ